MATYVIGDLHGCFDEWMRFKDRIETMDPEAVFILVGDIIDRGPKVFSLLGWCIRNISEDGKYQMVIGNHEYEQLKWERDDLVLSFYKMLPYYKDIVINGSRFIITHAALPESMVFSDYSLKCKADMDSHERFVTVWSRDLSAFDLIPGAILVHGHNPTVFEDSFRAEDYASERLGRIYNMGNRYNIDCGLVYDMKPGHRLAALRLEDLAEFYCDDPE